MKHSVIQYLIDLNKSTELKHQDGCIILGQEEFDKKEYVKPNLHTLSILDTKFFCKKAWRFDEDSDIVSLASQKYCDAVDITTPPLFYMQADKQTQEPNESPGYILSQDICSLGKLRSCLPYDLYGHTLKKYEKHSGKWEILNFPELKEFFLKYMTPECLDELIGVFLMDELRTDTDRHTFNYYLVKNPLSRKFEKVITFDLDNVYIKFKNFTNKQEFDFWTENIPYCTYTPVESLDSRTYKKRMRDIIELVHAGIFSDKNISRLKKAVQFDFPGTINSICQDIPCLEPYKDVPYETYSHLWDYTRDQLVRELGL